VVRIASVLWIALTIGHCADVTTPALYGRDINLYWDLRYMPDVAAMVAAAAPFWMMAAIVATIVAALFVFYILFRWAFARVVAAIDEPRARAAIAAGAGAAILVFAVQHIGEAVPAVPSFATPVSETYARQARLVAGAMSASTALPASPSFDADLSLARG